MVTVASSFCMTSSDRDLPFQSNDHINEASFMPFVRVHATVQYDTVPGVGVVASMRIL